MVKNLPAMQETQIQSLSQEDSLEKRMAHHSSIIAWKIPWTEESSRLQSIESQRAGHGQVTKHTHTHTHTHTQSTLPPAQQCHDELLNGF